VQVAFDEPTLAIVGMWRTAASESILFRWFWVRLCGRLGSGISPGRLRADDDAVSALPFKDESEFLKDYCRAVHDKLRGM